jgi:hypothetical protein
LAFLASWRLIFFVRAKAAADGTCLCQRSRLIAAVVDGEGRRREITWRYTPIAPGAMFAPAMDTNHQTQEAAMKKESRKLNLNRETLATMQSDELEGVAGGFTPTISAAVSAASRASSQACIKASAESVASLASAISAFFRTRGC